MNSLELKKRRESSGLTQDELAKRIGTSRKTINLYENGAKVPDSKAKLIDLVLKEIETFRNSDVTLTDTDTENEVEIFTNKNGIKFFLFPDDTTEIEVYQVPFPAYASYIEAFNDEEKLNHEFNKIRFKVDKIGKGNYVSFKSKNDSMNGGGLNDTPGGADILAREVGKHLWKDGFHKSVYGFILLTQKGIYHKDIKNYNKETGMLTLSSRNKACEDFEFPINEVFKIFNVIKRSF